MIVRIALCILVGCFFSGCLNKPDCAPSATDLVKIDFVNSSNAARNTTFDSIRVSGLAESIYKATTTSSVQLPLRYNYTEADFEFYFEQRSEKIKVFYDAQPQVISAECGAFTIFKDLTVAESTFEIYTVITSQTSTNATVNIQLRIE